MILKHNFSAAAKCLVAEIITTISPALITRVKERKENVKADIFHVYQSLLRVSQVSQADEGEVYQDPS